MYKTLWVTVFLLPANNKKNIIWFSDASIVQQWRTLCVQMRRSATKQKWISEVCSCLKKETDGQEISPGQFETAEYPMVCTLPRKKGIIQGMTLKPLHKLFEVIVNEIPFMD